MQRPLAPGEKALMNFDVVRSNLNPPGTGVSIRATTIASPDTSNSKLRPSVDATARCTLREGVVPENIKTPPPDTDQQTPIGVHTSRRGSGILLRNDERLSLLRRRASARRARRARPALRGRQRLALFRLRNLIVLGSL